MVAVTKKNKKKNQRLKQNEHQKQEQEQQKQSTSSSSVMAKILLLIAILFLLVVVHSVANNNNNNNDDDDDDTLNVNRTKSSKSKSGKSSNNRRIRTIPLPVLDQLFPFQSLDSAWENYPLLSTTQQPQQRDCNKDDYGNTKEQRQCVMIDDVSSITTAAASGSIRFHDNQIPTIYFDDDFSNDTNDGDNNDTTSTTKQYNSNKQSQWKRLELSSLITQNDVLQHVLNAPNLVHGSDYRIVKKVLIDGQEWTGSPPDHVFKASTPSMQQKHQRKVAQESIAFEGFSLIVNNLQQRWGPVAKMARLLEEEILPNQVSCNLYLTPPSPPDEHNVDTKLSGFESHWDFMDVIVMQLEGTKLWSVAKRPKMELSLMDQKHKPTMQDLTNYLDFETGRYDEFLLRPGDVLYIPRGFIHNASTTTTTDNDDSASLHITFGIEHSCQTTVEAFIHRAIAMYDVRGRTSANDSKIAIPRRACPLAGGRDIPWEHVVHFVLAEVARRDQVCTSTSDDSNHKSHNRSCLLRQSLPISPAFQQIKQNGNSSSSVAADTSVVVRDMLRNGLDVLVDLASAELTAQFIYRLETGDGESIRSFCHPYMSMSTTVPCHDALAKINMVDDAKRYNTMQSYLLELREYSMKEFDSIQHSFENHVAFQRTNRLTQQDEMLRVVGQSIIPPMNKK